MHRNAAETVLKQKSSVSVHMIQFLAVLHMDAQQLAEYVNKAALENPTIDIVRPCDDAKNGIFFKDITKQVHQTNHASEEGPEEYKSAGGGYESLQMLLKEQLSRKVRCSDEQLRLCEWMIRRLDKKGFLPQEDWDAVEKLPMAAEALALLQSLEPAGVAARSVRECLLLQLQRMDQNTRLSAAIVQNHLEMLERQQYKRLANLLGCSVADVKTAADQICRLHPYPAMSVSEDENVQTEYIYPDVEVCVNESGELEIRLNRMSNIQISVNRDYIKLYETTTDDTVREYLQEKIAGAHWLERSLRQRTKTYRDCIYEIVRRQRQYFLDKTETLRPMRLQELADEIGIHASTVSRTLRNSYLQSDRGTILVKKLFGGAVGVNTENELCSADFVKNRLQQILRDEDKERPFSDQDIAQRLELENIRISRRTVAKYRGLLRIPNQHERRRNYNGLSKAERDEKRKQ